MSEVEIEYCVSCGFRERAVDVEQAILLSLERNIDRLILDLSEHGVFVVRVDGETVFDKDEHDFGVDQIVREVRNHL